MKASQWLLFMLPCLLFAGAAVLLHGRKDVLPMRSNNQFQLVVNRVEFRRSRYENTQRKARALQKNQDLMIVYIFVDYLGQAPSWWLVNPEAGVNLVNVVFSDSKGRQVPVSCFLSGGGHDTRRRRILIDDCHVPQSPSLNGGTFTATACISGAGCARFTTPIREGKGDFKVFEPVVSRGIKMLDIDMF